MAEAPARPRWRNNLVAVLVSGHLFATLLYILPHPPYLDSRALNHPEVQRELKMLLQPLRLVMGEDQSDKELQDLVIGWVRSYTDGYFKVRKIVEPYIDLANIQQSWNMFGGTPPRFPRVFMVDIKPRGETAFVNFQDLHWGTADSAALNFRHRKAHEILSLGGWDRQREDYANHWARRWNALHPDRKAEQVRFYYWQLHTPTIDRIRKGDLDRRPERVMEFTWAVPAEVQ